MPKATASDTTERYDLVSCPEGFVVLRMLSYGEMLKRMDMAGKMVMEGKPGGSKDVEAIMEVAQTKVTQFEFANSIVEHNLEDENGTALNFKNPADIERLDPRIGEEISTLIDSLNQLPEEALGKSK